MASIVDDRGYNQGFKLVESTVVRMKRRAALFLSEMNSEQPSDVLEIGCGTGEISNWLAEGSPHRVVGTDICAPFIETAKSRYVRDNLAFKVLDFSNPSDISDGSYDYICGNGILHHLYPNLPSVLKTIRNLLKPGGKMIFMEPNIYNPYCAVIFNFTRELAKLEPDEMAFSRRYITRILRECGYSDIRVEYRDFLVPGIPAALIKPSILLGAVLEKTPVLRCLSQSLYLVATK